ncbi:nuclear transcription factor Y subunit beta-like isoform X1 [Ruditapes philippinarum]|uniref:nuclear transcription factor Y subunit beta-like isoform X1 n=1 Tax=Ruditapes philippinarum TaxID=129788 RepID=UPI00295BFBD8|nr:nuclear transcription factor Y subunit beta-like isoform X1 [Ruditapes philippinarum]XP_060579857.1 nuclear transcription factor Y subunit beta-like isoform X1 [Ruditapes philippinarum]XP_060579858.1 nuclear transcription factor Y subunit beta-like isoform X1 [Ruditapes philippinarum]XP_060579859.1 nuclear transcription factor Y subunit beta-like isoform X1 [Ruditapes philippinarum]XP_060579860.1 nuclear transcription factor Y subunit beta-like isoform X1 [Ruditapes philippinarum]
MMDGGGDGHSENSMGETFFQAAGGQIEGQEGEEQIDSGDNDDMPKDNEPLREQDRFLPIANVARIMKRSIPKSGKIAKDAKECVQECVSEFISFITSEASERCHQEKRKTINGEDILFAMSTLGFDSYVEPLKQYLQKYRESNKGGEKPLGVAEGDMNDLESAGFELQSTLAANMIDPNGQQSVIYATTFPNQGTLQQINFGGVGM